MTPFLRWIRSHRSFAATGLSAIVIAVVATTLGLTSSGYQAQRLDLDDGTVWVANDSLTAIGRANPAVLELNSAVKSTGADLAVVQDGAHVLLVDRSDATVGVVDTATASIGQTVPLPPNSPDVLLARNTAVVVSGKTGELWSTPVSELDSFDSSAPAQLSLGAGVATGITPSGTMVAYSADSGDVTRVDDVTQFAVSATHRLKLPKSGSYQVASVGSHWAVLNTKTGLLVVDGRRIDLSSRVQGRVALQQSADSGSSVLVASSSGLLSVSFGGAVSTRVQGRDGAAARPVTVAGCAYAAWADGAGWNDCSSGGRVRKLASMPASASLVFGVNGSHVVLNDSSGGSSWAVQRSGQLIDNWSDLITDEKDQQEKPDQTTDDQQKLEVQQKPPVAVDDVLGARPGRATILPVLLNDYDPNGDPIVIGDVTGVPASAGRVDVVENRQHVLLTLPASASGVIVFDYSISDGRGGTASAKVTVTIRQPGENSPPQQVRAQKAVVSSSGRVTVSTLGAWIDPDGDPLYLAGASGGDGGTVTYKPTGEVVYQDRGKGPSTQDIVLSVSDGTAVGRGAMTIGVGAEGDVPLKAESFSVEAYQGEALRVKPLRYASGGTGPIKLNSVPAKQGVTVVPNYAAGTFSFVSSVPGPHNLDYTITDGEKTATGTVRIDVQAAPEPNTPPVTTPKTVFVQSLSTQSVDITASDFDPAGNVLMVTDVDSPDAATGVQVQTVEQRYLRITLTAPLDHGPVPFTYTVTNGLASAQGSVTVVQIPRPSRLQPPIATNDQATARVGDAVDIDVLANDSQPDGEEITLEPRLVKNVSSGGGLLFVSGTRLRYLAPKTPGNFTAEYAVDGPDGQRATAQVSISVREADAATNNPPVPTTLTARVVAGQSVRIQVPLEDIDPDGDSVQLLGADSNPQKGSVTTVGSSFIDYEAGSYSAGTDTFTYTVIDGLGARATGTVRVGIAARAQGARNPIAVADAVTMRPGGSILIRVLANDSDPDGGALHVTAVEPNDAGVKAEILKDGVVRVTPPREAKTYGLVYTIANAVGGSNSNFITVKVDPTAELNYPEAQDSTLTLSDVLGRKTVMVNVLANVFFADGNVSTLGLGVQPGYGATAEVTSTHRIRVTITDQSQIIPFYVTHPKDPSIKAYAFIRVPGFDDALPQLKESAPPLTVVSEKPLTIDLNKYVVATGSNGVRLTDSSTVRATHANGADLVVDQTTLRYTSAAAFYGQASISFEVTDGTSATDPKGHTATLALPITVTARANQPPVLNGAAIDLEPGDSRTLDLTRVTTYKYPRDIGQLRYSITSPDMPGLTTSLSGQKLTVRASADAKKNTRATVGLTVRDDASPPQAGSISLTVVGSTRPLAIAASDSAIAKRGTRTTVDVLANDEATNPFPGQPLRVVAIRGLDGASLPAGVSVAPSGDKSRLTVTVGPKAKPLDTHLQYQLADVTNDPSRYVWGNVTISVQDAPDAPSAPIRSGTFVGGELTLAYQAPVANNSPITSYRLTGSSESGAYTKDCGVSTLCTLTDLAPGVRYRFTVQAVNAIGTSSSSPPSAPYSSDFVPAAPAGVTITPSPSSPRALVVSWNTVPRPARGTAVTGYVVEMGGDGAPGTQRVSGTSVTIGGLTAGARYSAQVYATNSAQVSSAADWARSAPASGTAVGVPPAVGNLSASSDASSGNVTLDWSGVDAQGTSGVTYSVARRGADAPAPQGCSPSSKPSAIDTGLSATHYVDTTASEGSHYTYYVYADNGIFCSVSNGSTVSVYKAPGQASVPQADLVETAAGSGYFDVKLSGFANQATASAQSYWLYVDGVDTGRSVKDGDVVTGSADATVYGAQHRYAVKACRVATESVCGPVSGAVTIVPVNANAIGTPTYTPSDPSQNGIGTWRFTLPAGPGYTGVEYQCGGAFSSDGATSCSGSGPDPQTAPPLRIRVTANGDSDHVKTYTAPPPQSGN